MKIVQINSTCGVGSTGKICVAVSELLTASGIENYIMYTFGNSVYSKGKRYMSWIEIKWQALKAKVFGNYGFQSKMGTRRLIAEIEKISPDIIHLHNIHSHNVHLDELFTYLRKRKIKIYWTFHDCWAFTGYCPHYYMAKCEKWKTKGCGNCPQRASYSWFIDRSKTMFDRKKQLFTGLDLVIITPSQWLANEVNNSFLRGIPVEVISNGIDLSVFYPCMSDFRTIHNLRNRFVILGVAFGWGTRKGLDVFIRLATRLDSEKFQIVLVGTDDKIDKILPKNVISIHRTTNQKELAEIYTMADIFVNPTREDTYPTVNMEALACGTPVITFRTGGSPEIIDEKTGIVVECEDEDALYNAIVSLEKKNDFLKEDCLERAKLFDSGERFKEYVSLYNRRTIG